MPSMLAAVEVIGAAALRAAGAVVIALVVLSRRRPARGVGRYRTIATAPATPSASVSQARTLVPSPPPVPVAAEQERRRDDGDLKLLAARVRRAAERRHALDAVSAQLRRRANATGELLAQDVLLDHGRVRIPLLLASPRGVFAIAPDAKWTLEDCDALRDAASALRDSALPGYPGDLHCAIVLPDASGDGEPKQWFTMNGNQCWVVGGSWLDRWLDAHDDGHLASGDLAFLRARPAEAPRP